MNYISYFKIKGTLKNDSKYPALSLIAFILKIVSIVYLVIGLLGSLIMSFVWADEAGKMGEVFGGHFSFGSALSSFFFSLIGGVIITVLLFLLIWAFAELILVIMDIESNTSGLNKGGA